MHAEVLPTSRKGRHGTATACSSFTYCRLCDADQEGYERASSSAGGAEVSRRPLLARTTALIGQYKGRWAARGQITRRPLLARASALTGQHKGRLSAYLLTAPHTPLRCAEAHIIAASRP